MNKTVITGLIVLSIFLIIPYVLIANPIDKKNMSKENVKIIFYKHGKKTILNPQSPHYSELQQKCEEFFGSAVSMARCFISKKMILAIKERECALEIVYSKPKEIEIVFFKRNVKADHLLIPLSGKYVGTGKNASIMMFFYNRTYNTSPYSTHRDIMEIKGLLELMNVDIE